MIRTLFISLLLTSFTVNAKLPPSGRIAPAYQSLKKIDAAINTLAKGGGKTGLATKKPGDVMIASANMTKNKTTGLDLISVGLDGQMCSLIITEQLPPKGVSGASSYSANVISCSRFMNVRAPDLMKYEDVRTALSIFASKNKVNLSFSIVATPQGPVVKLRN